LSHWRQLRSGRFSEALCAVYHARQPPPARTRATDAARAHPAPVSNWRRKAPVSLCLCLTDIFAPPLCVGARCRSRGRMSSAFQVSGHGSRHVRARWPALAPLAAGRQTCCSACTGPLALRCKEARERDEKTNGAIGGGLAFEVRFPASALFSIHNPAGRSATLVALTPRGREGFRPALCA
jgi:hypothetical protein